MSTAQREPYMSVAHFATSIIMPEVPQLPNVNSQGRCVLSMMEQQHGIPRQLLDCFRSQNGRRSPAPTYRRVWHFRLQAQTRPISSTTPKRFQIKVQPRQLSTCHRSARTGTYRCPTKPQGHSLVRN
jgi:hypothetical protein